MARRRGLIGVVRPTTTSGLAATAPPPSVVHNAVTGPAGAVWLGSDDPLIDVVAQLRAPVSSPLPRPKVDIVDRPIQLGLTQYLGQDPYELTLPIMFDRFVTGDTVEPDIRALEQLAERAPGATDQPVIRIEGPVPHKDLRWRVNALTEVTERTQYNGGGARCRFAVDVALIQAVTDEWLTQTLNQSRGTGRGIANRKTTVRSGEDLYDIARREYSGDLSRARDIARANSINGRPLRLGQRLPVGLELRLPA